MNRSAASATYYPFQVMPRFLFGRQGDVYYIGGSDILPPPLESQREASWGHQRKRKPNHFLLSTIFGLWCILRRNLTTQG